MPDTLLDAYGHPAEYVSNGAYQGPMDEMGIRVRHATMFGDWAALLSKSRWNEAVSDCRWIAQAFGLVSGAIDQKADYVTASGLYAVFDGEDDAYGDELEDACAEADKVCNVRGPRFSNKETWRLVIKALATDGAIFLVPTRSADGFPQMQLIEAHRIGQRDNTKTTVQTGRFKGARIRGGIIYSKAGTEIGYNVLGLAENGSDDVQLDSSEMWHIARPRNVSEGRPLPDIAPAILDLWDAREARESAKMQLIIDGRLTLIESNQTGKPDPVRNVVNPPPGLWSTTNGGSQVDVLEKGATRYIKTGNSVTPFQTSRPSDQWQRFDTRIVHSAFYALGWRAEMFDLSSLGGSTTRAFQDQINTSIYGTYFALLPYLVRWRQYQVASLTKYGWLKPNAEWYRVGVTPPPEFTCDPSRSVTSDIDGVRAGFESMLRVHGRWGTTSKQILREQTRYLKQRRAEAQKSGFQEYEYGTLSKPGDVIPQATTQQIENEDDSK